MDIEVMREEFEREWGQVDKAAGVHFIPELNTYGSELYAQHEYAQMKSSAWFYFQKGWNTSRSVIEVELPDYTSPYYGGDHFDECQYAADVEKSIHATGIRTK